MKAKIVIAAFVVAALAALVFSLGVFAQSGTTTNASNSSGCQLIDSEAPSAGTSATGGTSGTSGGTAATSTPATAATPAASPTAAATSSTGAAGTPAPVASPTATTSSTGSTGGTVTTGVVSEPHESPICANGVQADVAIPNGGSASFANANADAFQGQVPMTVASNNGAIPVTGSNGTSSNTNTTVVLSPQSLNFGQAVKLSVSDSSGKAVSAAHMEICFQDASQSGTIYQWYDTNMWATWYKSTTTPARWVRVPTTRNGTMACGTSWLPGTFALAIP